jgi:hypothetical protein
VTEFKVITRDIVAKHPGYMKPGGRSGVFTSNISWSFLPK